MDMWFRLKGGDPFVFWAWSGGNRYIEAFGFHTIDPGNYLGELLFPASAGIPVDQAGRGGEFLGGDWHDFRGDLSQIFALAGTKYCDR